MRAVLCRKAGYEALAAVAAKAAQGPASHLQLYVHAHQRLSALHPFQLAEGSTVERLLLGAASPAIISYEVMKLSHEEAAQTQQLCVQWLPSGDPQQEAATDSATADTSPGEPSIQPTLQLGGSPSASPARRRLLHLRVQKPATVLDIKVAVAREASEVLQGIELYLVSGMNCEITRVLRNDEAVEGLLTGGLTLYGL